MRDTLAAATTRVLHDLDDEEEQIWSRAQVNSWIQEGYDRLVRQTDCLFDMIMYSNESPAANHTRKFEEQFMIGEDFPIFGLFQFTREVDRDFAGPGAEGPYNNTRPTDTEYVTRPAARLIAKLPEGYTKIDRVTHDWLRLEPEHARYLRDNRRIYETQQGGVFSYSIEQDGLFSLRTVGVPAPRIPAVTQSGLFGLLRQEDAADLLGDTIMGTFGILRAWPTHYAGGGQWGTPRNVIEDDHNTRVEYFRLGKRLTESPFEIPPMYVEYVQHWAMSSAYSVAGPGEDRALADHYEARFEIGVQRLLKRVKSVMDERTIHMGVTRDGARDSYLSLFPTDYGRPRPFRR